MHYSLHIETYCDDLILFSHCYCGFHEKSYKYIPDDEAVIALREQEQRYNGRRRKKKARLSFGEYNSRRSSRDSYTTLQNDKHDSVVPLPDYLKAKIDREEDIRKKGGLRKGVSFSALNWLNTGVIQAQDIIQVHPATHLDPFSKEGNTLGTSSLRLSGTKYVKNNTFSVILPSMQGKLVQKHFPSVDLSEKWYVSEIEQLCFGSFRMIIFGHHC